MKLENLNFFNFCNLINELAFIEMSLLDGLKWLVLMFLGIRSKRIFFMKCIICAWHAKMQTEESCEFVKTQDAHGCFYLHLFYTKMFIPLGGLQLAVFFIELWLFLL